MDESIKIGIGLELKEAEAQARKITGDVNKGIVTPISNSFDDLGSRISKAMLEPFADNNHVQLVQGARRTSSILQETIGAITEDPRFKKLREDIDILPTLDVNSKEYQTKKRGIEKGVREQIGEVERLVESSMEANYRKAVYAKQTPAFLEKLLGTEDDIRIAVRDWADNLTKEVSEKTTRQGSGGMFPAYFSSVMYSLGATANQYVRYLQAEQTAFDLSSPEAFYSARRAYEIEGKRIQGRTEGTLWGTGLGAIGMGTYGLLAAPATGGVSAIVSMLVPYIMGQLGGEIGGTIAEGEAKEMERDLKIRQALSQTSREGLAAFSNYDIASSKVRGRFGTDRRAMVYADDLGRMGLSDTQIAQLEYQYGSTGLYNKTAFENAVQYEAAKKLPFGSSFVLNPLSYQTGVSFNRWTEIEKLTGKYQGQDPRMINAIAQLSQMINQTTGGFGESVYDRAFGLTGLPKVLAGGTPLGDVMLDGMKMIDASQQMFRGKSPAADFMVKQALGLGTDPIWDVWRRQRAGIFDEKEGGKNLSRILDYARRTFTALGRPQSSWAMGLAENFLPEDTPLNVIDMMVKAMANTNDPKYMTELETAMKPLRMKKKSFKGEAESKVSETEDWQSRMENIRIDIGERTGELIRNAEAFSLNYKKMILDTARGLSLVGDMLGQQNIFLSEVLSSLEKPVGPLRYGPQWTGYSVIPQSPETGVMKFGHAR